MPKITGVKELSRTLQKYSRDLGKKVGYKVGYTAEYALVVHEDLEARHEPGKTAKYLEGPARELNNSGEFTRLFTQTYMQTRSIEQSLLIVCLRLLRDSQLVVPVDTGALKASGFVKKDEG